ncbi:hypothetical protein Ahy_A02g006832 isoform F [Arachis hypogaea]|uniref:Uncharacterized protein n=1 Tax=Arachis hypogaea TaxID=3818 RepID=A0A445EAV2_ARAHY|nr:hypothetical protein Ahy_A02g006832 isoform F [Arachis hypogaea]
MLVVALRTSTFTLRVGDLLGSGSMSCSVFYRRRTRCRNSQSTTPGFRRHSRSVQMGQMRRQLGDLPGPTS